MEKPILKFPSREAYIWPKVQLSEPFEKQAKVVEMMTPIEVQDALTRYSDLDFSNPWEKNTLEMMALYQRALTLFGRNTKVDGFFWRSTRIALQEFQKSNGLIPDGIPGKRTTELILRKLWEKIETHKDEKPYTVKEARETLKITEKDREHITRIFKKSRESSPLHMENSPYSQYNGKDWNNIEYAYVKQSDGWYYVFDKTSEDTPVRRNVYMTDKDFNVLGVAEVDWWGRMQSLRWKSFTAPFDPVPRFTKK